MLVAVGAGAIVLGAGPAGPVLGRTPVPVPPADTLTVVGLGDSVPAATTCDCASYVELVGRRLDRLTGRSWAVHNDAHDGWTTADVEADLDSPTTREHLAAADLVVVEVGANDLDLDRVDDRGCFPAATSRCYADTLTSLTAGLTRIVAGIRTTARRPDLRIALLGYWNVTLDGQVGQQLGDDFVAGSDALTREVDRTVEQVATTVGAVYVDAYTPFKGASGAKDPTAHLLDDGDHLNASGHTLMADTVVSDLERAGAVGQWVRHTSSGVATPVRGGSPPP